MWRLFVSPCTKNVLKFGDSAARLASVYAVCALFAPTTTRKIAVGVVPDAARKIKLVLMTLYLLYNNANVS